MRRCAVVMLTGCSFSPGQFRQGDAGTTDDSTRDDGTTIIDATFDAQPDGPPITLREKPITIGNAATGTHAGFPLWVSLTDAEIDTRARADGADIHFVDGNGVDLDYELQRWSGGTLEAWVRVPSLTAGTQLAVRYGDVTAAHPPAPAAVFASYLAVWHLDDAFANTTVADARNTVNGTSTGLAASDRVADAQLGAGVDFKSGTDQIAFTNPLTGNGPHTISMWIDQRATTNNDAIVVLGTGATNQARWFHSRFDQATIAVGFYGNDYADPDEDVQGDGWVLLHWTYDGSTGRSSRLYRGGNLVAGPFQHASGVNTAGTSGLIGNAPGAFGSNMGLAASLDEVRISNVARSAEWIATEAMNQTTPGTFYTVGAERIP